MAAARRTVGWERGDPWRIDSRPILHQLIIIIIKLGGHEPLAAALALGVGLASTAHASEGMWMPTQLPELAKTLKQVSFLSIAATELQNLRLTGRPKRPTQTEASRAISSFV